MTDSITVPESLRIYLDNQAVHTAVIQLLETKQNSIDRSFLWTELRQYHEALFSAYRVRRDYTILLFDLMEEICLIPARERKLIKFLPLSKDNYANEGLPSPVIIWNDGLYCVLEGPNGKGYVCFFLSIGGGDEDNDKEGNIELCLNSDVVVMYDLLPLNKWLRVDDDYGWRLKDTVSLKKESIDVKRLRETVAVALDAILERSEAV